MNCQRCRLHRIPNILTNSLMRSHPAIILFLLLLSAAVTAGTCTRKYRRGLQSEQ
jgi:hypothetical protein